MRVGFLIGLLILGGCGMLTAMGMASGRVPYNPDAIAAANDVDTALSNWWYLLLFGGGLGAAELTPLRPIRRTYHAARRRHQTKKVVGPATPVGG